VSATTKTGVVAVVAFAALTGCRGRSEEGACVLPTQMRGGGASEVCFYQTEKTCLATPPAVSGERPPLWLRRKTCPEAGFTCLGNGFGTGTRRVQVDGTCPPGSARPF
jgi:hypothetical protein